MSCVKLAYSHFSLNQLQDMTRAVERAKIDFESSHKALLQRLFPKIKVEDAKDLTTFTEGLAKKLHAEVTPVLERTVKEKVQEAADANIEEVKKLEKQVEQYKTVLAQTVSRLSRYCLHSALNPSIIHEHAVKVIPVII